MVTSQSLNLQVIPPNQIKTRLQQIRHNSDADRIDTVIAQMGVIRKTSLLHSTEVQSNNNNLNEDGYRSIEKSQAREPLIHLAGAPDYSAKK
ncbi:hypothetical protein JTE90_016165 [Oedothorax gibbosus]|uniref:Uncharacterized protein n=1 Tax=Oedothorax gibbosus TaxID=931172 RepID=A0AAV6UTE7_9ARAC|nr:hypothetical protein JTE90_016165 [Oedothorax gibbosus]